MNQLLFFSFFEQARKDAQSTEHKEAVEAALNSLNKVYGYDESKASDLNLPVPIADVFKEGCAKLCPEALAESGAGEAETRDPVEDTAKFQKFLKTVTDRGAFGKLEPSSDEYKATYKKVVQKFKQRFGDSGGQEGGEAQGTAEADKFKSKGNDLLRSGDYEGSYAAYTKAIELSPSGENTHIYYCNRAAVLLHLERNEEATKDCSKSLAIKPSYVKAHTRMAQALLKLGNKEDALKSAQRALEIDPSNKTAPGLISAAGGSSTAPTAAAGARAGPGAGAGGMPGMPPGLGGVMGEMMKNPELMSQMNSLKQSMENGGGMPDIGSMMSNPAFMQMAQNMMQNPAMMEMAQNMARDPSAMQNMMGAMGGGGMPDMGDLLGSMGNMGVGDGKDTSKEDNN